MSLALRWGSLVVVGEPKTVRESIRASSDSRGERMCDLCSLQKVGDEMAFVACCSNVGEFQGRFLILGENNVAAVILFWGFGKK